VIALDPVRENMREVSAKAAKKPERGGVPNALFVVASIEQPPDELRGVADEIFVTLPWGSLMRGIILGDAQVIEAIASFGAQGARVRIVLNTRIFDEPVPIEARDLPEVTPDYARDTLTPAFDSAGMLIGRADWMDADQVATLGTTWAKRLSHRRPPRSVVIDAAVSGSPQ
jgi:16S rRNA (adenine(1408)-N(1))-methyltransferase